MQYILDRVRITEMGCWEWQQSLNPQTGYGQVGFKPYTAHRLAFYFEHGRYPNQVARHICHNRRCCNPAHLAEGSPSDNWHDSEHRYRASNAARRGTLPSNARPVTIEGVDYPSKSAAMRALNISWATLQRLSE